MGSVEPWRPQRELGTVAPLWQELLPTPDCGPPTALSTKGPWAPGEMVTPAWVRVQGEVGG